MSGIQPQLWIESAAAAVVFYEAAFGAEVLRRVGSGDEIVVQPAIGDSAFWVSSGGSEGPRFSPMVPLLTWHAEGADRSDALSGAGVQYQV